MHPEIIASMTSYPARIGTVHLAVESLLQQTEPFDRIILWLADTQFPNRLDDLPAPLVEQLSRGLEIIWCDDLRSYKRQYYAFRDFPEDAVVIVDDDLIYPYDMLAELKASWERFPNAVSAMRVHMISFDDNGEIAPYASWKYEYSGLIGVPSMALYATPGGGTLVPPGCIHNEAFDLENITGLCPTADDVWMKVMYTLTGTPVVLAAENRPLLEIPETQAQALWRDNCVQHESDRQRRLLLEKYDNYHGSGDTLTSRILAGAFGVAERKRPSLTIILAPGASEADVAHIRTIDYADAEVIVCDDAGAAEGLFTASLRHATLASAGDYVYYLMPGERLVPGALTDLMDRIRELETKPNRLYVDILDTLSAAGRVTGDAVLQAMLDGDPDRCLSGKLMRGALCRLAFRHIDETAFANAHPSSLAFILGVCAKGYHGTEMHIFDGVSSVKHDLTSTVKAIECVAQFMRAVGGEDAFAAEFGHMCAALMSRNSGTARIFANAFSIMAHAQNSSRELRDELCVKIKSLSSAADRAEKTTLDLRRDLEVSRGTIREKDKTISEIRSSSIFKVGRIVTLIPRKIKLLLQKLLDRN